MTKIADHAPAYCSSCYGVVPGQRYVDFEAFWDGPVIPGDIPQPLDDLILCEPCLEEAFALLDSREESDEIQKMTSLLERAQGDIEAKDRMIGRLRMTTNELVEHPIKMRPGIGNFAGVDEEINAFLTKRRKKRSERSRKAKASQNAD